MTNTCPICGRKYGGPMEDHHLKPRTFRTRTKEVHNSDNLVRVHRICHSAIHAFFKEKELLKYYHTIPRLVEHPDMERFVAWVKSKPTDFYTTMRRSNRRK